MRYRIETPDNAPCCLLAVADDGRSLLIQTDWDWPGFASDFGWTPARVQVQNYSYYGGKACPHDGTDGTVDCDSCGMTATAFITDAGRMLRELADSDESAEDPGYSWDPVEVED